MAASRHGSRSNQLKDPKHEAERAGGREREKKRTVNRARLYNLRVYLSDRPRKATLPKLPQTRFETAN